MFTHTILLAAVLLSVSAAPLRIPATATASMFGPDGGPPRISVSNKATGDITKSEWTNLKTVELHGCVPDARITSLTLCIRDCKAKEAVLRGTNEVLTKEMKTMITNLPSGTPFTVKVVVKDAKGKVWDVPDATYVWKG